MPWGFRARGQAPTIEESGILLKGAGLSTPGSMSSLLGPMPGSSGITFGMQPGRDDMILGRVGLGAPRVPTSITTPGGVYQGPRPAQGIAAPKPTPIPPPLRYGSMELPMEEDEGPANGLTLDQAIELLVQGNLDLRAKLLEIPQARADVLTASLRANPIFYADSQLVPYGTNSVQKPDGPTQYDINVSHPIDYSHKRQARMAYAARALKVLEAQYQNEVRLAIGNLYGAFVDVLAAREDIRALRKSLDGNNEIVRIHQELYEKKGGTRADLDQAKSEREIVVAGLLDAEETLLEAKAGTRRDSEPRARGSRAARGAREAFRAGPAAAGSRRALRDWHATIAPTWPRSGWASMPRLPTCSCSGRIVFPTRIYFISRTRFKTMHPTGNRAARRGRWGSRFRCPCTIATRATSTGRGSTSRRRSSS